MVNRLTALEEISARKRKYNLRVLNLGDLLVLNRGRMQGNG